jgi:hypothetical protein
MICSLPAENTYIFCSLPTKTRLLSAVFSIRLLKKLMFNYFFSIRPSKIAKFSLLPRSAGPLTCARSVTHQTMPKPPSPRTTAFRRRPPPPDAAAHARPAPDATRLRPPLTDTTALHCGPRLTGPDTTMHRRLLLPPPSTARHPHLTSPRRRRPPPDPTSNTLLGLPRLPPYSTSPDRPRCRWPPPLLDLPRSTPTSLATARDNLRYPARPPPARPPPASMPLAATQPSL